MESRSRFVATIQGYVNVDVTAHARDPLKISEVTIFVMGHVRSTRYRNGNDPGLIMAFVGTPRFPDAVALSWFLSESGMIWRFRKKNS